MISPMAIMMGIIIGFLMPLISNVLAVQKALGKKIIESLNILKTATNDIVIKIIKLENFGISLFEIGIAIIFVVMGTLTYLVVPAAFFYRNYDVVFLSLSSVLIGMIIGVSFF